MSRIRNGVGEIRRSAVIMTYGPGAIMDLRVDDGPVSGVSAGLEEWDSSAPLSGNLRLQKIIERRLSKKLQKRYFRLPPVVEEGATQAGSQMLDQSALVTRRFPTWLQCPSCDAVRRSAKWGHEPGQAARFCYECSDSRPNHSKVMVHPVRFATACAKGHLDEFPFSWWVHQKATCTNSDEFTIRSHGPGLSGIFIECSVCGRRSSLDGAFRKSALRGLTCRAKRPWLRTDDPECDQSAESGDYRVVQRGASNLYFPVMESAIDIPPWSGKLEEILSDHWDVLDDIISREGRLAYISDQRSLVDSMARTGITAEELCDEFDRLVSQLREADVENLRKDEYLVLSSKLPTKDLEFESRPREVVGEFGNKVDLISRIVRLREVRVLKAFTRIEAPSALDTDRYAPLSVSPLDWLPALEIRGEGIFVRLNHDRIAEWEVQSSITDRFKELTQMSGGSSQELSTELRHPRFYLIHTLAHFLIRQLTLDCGYPSASLRERLYFGTGDEAMCGVLIYTGTPDSDGTLGGLQSRGKRGLFEDTLSKALATSEWCPSDPLCLSGELGGSHNSSLAACHSCSMLPETSCEFFNQGLDRALLVGLDNVNGFFEMPGSP
jgi:hypothetical protein